MKIAHTEEDQNVKEPPKIETVLIWHRFPAQMRDEHIKTRFDESIENTKVCRSPTVFNSIKKIYFGSSIHFLK